MSIREAGRVLGVHENTVRNLIAAGKLEAEMIGASQYRRVTRDSVSRLTRLLAGEPDDDGVRRWYGIETFANARRIDGTPAPMINLGPWDSTDLHRPGSDYEALAPIPFRRFDPIRLPPRRDCVAYLVPATSEIVVHDIDSNVVEVIAQAPQYDHQLLDLLADAGVGVRSSIGLLATLARWACDGLEPGYYLFNTHRGGRVLAVTKNRRKLLHSDYGFTWGYGGTGPSEVHDAIMRHALGERYRQRYPKSVVDEISEALWHQIQAHPQGSPWVFRFDTYLQPPQRRRDFDVETEISKHRAAADQLEASLYDPT